VFCATVCFCVYERHDIQLSNSQCSIYVCYVRIKLLTHLLILSCACAKWQSEVLFWCRPCVCPCNNWTSISWTVRLSWFENAHWYLLLSAYNFDRWSIGETDLGFGVRSGLISRSVRAKLQVSVRSGCDLCHPC